MKERPLLSELTADELMARATEYRRMARDARTVETREALNRLCIRFALLAARRILATDNG